MAKTMTVKIEDMHIHRIVPWKAADAVEWETLKWVDWDNNRRLPKPIAIIPPADTEETCCEPCKEFDKAA